MILFMIVQLIFVGVLKHSVGLQLDNVDEPINASAIYEACLQLSPVTLLMEDLNSIDFWKLLKNEEENEIESRRSRGDAVILLGNTNSRMSTVARALFDQSGDSVLPNILLLVPQSSLRLEDPNNIGDFDKLLKAFFKTTRKLRSMERGIGMVVTNVKDADRRGDNGDDDIVVNRVQKFLSNYVEHLRGTGEGEVSHAKRVWNVPFINSGIHKDEGIRRRMELGSVLLQPNKIRVLRVPNVCRNLIKLVFKERRRIRRSLGLDSPLLEVGLDPGEPGEPGEAGEAGKDDIEILYSDLSHSVSLFVDKLNLALMESTLAVHNLNDLKSSLVSFHSACTDVETNNTKSQVELGALISESLKSHSISVESLAVKAFGAEMKSYDAKISKIQSTAGDGNSTDWLHSLKTWCNGVRHKSAWYSYIVDIYAGLSTLPLVLNADFEIRSPTKLNSFLGSLGPEAAGLGMPESLIEAYEKGEVTRGDAELLWEVIKGNADAPKITCSSKAPYEMTVAGGVVQASQFVNSDSSFKKCGSNVPSKVLVFAKSMLKLDKNIKPVKSSDTQIEFVLFSPETEVAKKLEVDLKGHNGEHGTPIGGGKAGNSNAGELGDGDGDKADLATSKREVAEDGKEFGILDALGSKTNFSVLPQKLEVWCGKHDEPHYKEGMPGKTADPGNHGYPGGRFVLSSYSVKGTNSDTKLIIAGGWGGNGAHGEKGGEGKTGKVFEAKFWEDYTEGGYVKGYGPCSYDCAEVPKGSDCKVEGWDWKRAFDRCYNDKDGYCLLYGCLGGTGGKGGDGGARGLKGERGEAVISTRDSSPPFVIMDYTVDGQIGGGGVGGAGGLRGSGTVQQIEYAVTSPKCGGSWVKPKSAAINKFAASSGKDGENGVNKDKQPPMVTKNYVLRMEDVYLRYKESAFVDYTKSLVLFEEELKFHDYLATSTNLQFTAIDFAKELLLVEHFHIQLSIDKTDADSISMRMTPIYTSFISRLQTYGKNKNLVNQDRKLISLIYAVAVNQKRALLQALGSPVVTDIQGYLTVLGKRLDKFSKIKSDKDKQAQVEEQRTQYKKLYEEKQLQAMDFIRETVYPAVLKSQEELKGVNEQFSVKIKEYIAEAVKTQEMYEKMLSEMKSTMALRTIFSALELGGTFAMIAGGPWGALIAGAISIGKGIGEELLLGPEKEIPELPPLDPAIKKILDQIEKDLKTAHQKGGEQFETLATTAVETLKAANAEIGDMVDKNYANTFVALVKEFKGIQLQAVKPAKTTVESIEVMRHKLEEEQQSVTEYIEERKDFIDKASKGKAGTPEEQKKAKKNGAKVIEGLGSGLEIFGVILEVGLGTFLEYQKNLEKMKELGKLVGGAAGQVEELRKFRDAVMNNLIPMMEKVRDALNDAASGGKGKTQVYLEVQKWEIKKTLKNFNRVLQEYSGTWPDIAKQYDYVVKDIEDGMTLVMDLHAFIDQYAQQMQLADYIANINSPTGRNTQLGGEAGEIYERINLALLGSLITSEWDVAYQTFQQWVFPFADVFVGRFNSKGIPNYLRQEIKTTPQLLNDLIPAIRDKFDSLQTEIETYKSASFNPIDDKIIHSKFNSDSSSLIPFHVWKWEKNEKFVNELMSGNWVDISVHPDFPYEHGWSAVKFTIAEIEPKGRTKDVQDKLNGMLVKLKVEMEHSGISYYLYKKDVFEMVGTKLTFQYNFERDSKTGERHATNSNYQKVQKGDMILSPFTHWRVKFSKAHNNINFDFKELAKLSKSVDVELIGVGSYVVEKNKKKKSFYGPSSVRKTHLVPLHYYGFMNSRQPRFIRKMLS